VYQQNTLFPRVLLYHVTEKKHVAVLKQTPSREYAGSQDSDDFPMSHVSCQQII